MLPPACTAGSRCLPFDKRTDNAPLMNCASNQFESEIFWPYPSTVIFNNDHPHPEPLQQLHSFSNRQIFSRPSIEIFLFMFIFSIYYRECYITFQMEKNSNDCKPGMFDGQELIQYRLNTCYHGAVSQCS